MHMNSIQIIRKKQSTILTAFFIAVIVGLSSCSNLQRAEEKQVTVVETLKERPNILWFYLEAREVYLLNRYYCDGYIEKLEKNRSLSFLPKIKEKIVFEFLVSFSFTI